MANDVTEKLIIGMMSGTSADGIDAVLAHFESPTQIKVIDKLFTEFPAALRDQINQTAFEQTITQCSDSELHDQLANNYAEACLALIEKNGISKSEIHAVANHGQTVRHEPSANPPFSLQLGNPQIIADLTGLLTVANFRQADIAAGGQGAPLMPAFHSAIFGENKENESPRFLLNIGGIANLTYLGEPVIGFDTGPGNTLLDQWIYQHQGVTYDCDGDWAASGTSNPLLLEALIRDPYFNKPFPKSTGPDYFNLTWLHKHLEDLEILDNKLPAQDVQATLLELTVLSIANELKQLGNLGGEIFVCGGGAHNKLLISRLKEMLGPYHIYPSDNLGIPADWVEAAGFAWLGYCRLLELVNNLPSVTGASESLVLGEVFFPNTTR